MTLGRLSGCASVAEAAGGAAIVAGVAVSRDYRGELRVAVRDPGATFGPPVRLAATFGRPAVAIAPSGAAAVAWVQGGSLPDSERRLVVVRRPPGGAFGARETVTSWRGLGFLEPVVRAAIDAAGTVTVLLSRERVTESGGIRIDVATATPHGGFTVQRLTADPDVTRTRCLPSPRTGWALVTHKDHEAPPDLFERAPGAMTFSAVAVPGPVRRSYEDPTVAVRSGGGALVAWRTGTNGVDALMRETAGPFSSRRVGEPVPIRELNPAELGVGAIDPFEGPPVSPDPPSLQAALAPDGRVVLRGRRRPDAGRSPGLPRALPSAVWTAGSSWRGRSARRCATSTTSRLCSPPTAAPRVVVHATAPGGRETAVRSRRIPVIGLRSLPLRAPRDVEARRDGAAIVVTWRTAQPARRQTYIVIGERRRAPDGGFDPSAYALEDGGGHTRFRVRLRPTDPDRIVTVTVFVESYDSGEDGPGSTVACARAARSRRA